MKLSKRIAREELRKIAEANEGTLPPSAVVDAARGEEHPLHEHFEWDDSEAGERYRLIQAGRLIRTVNIVIAPRDNTPRTMFIGEVIRQEAREWESLPSDRKSGKGYRRVEEIMADPTKRKEMLSVALSELKAVEQRHSTLQELANVWREAAKVAREQQSA